MYERKIFLLTPPYSLSSFFTLLKLWSLYSPVLLVRRRSIFAAMEKKLSKSPL
jgi:hypothetical protein